jgi:putative DNA primase/helicase
MQWDGEPMNADLIAAPDTIFVAFDGLRLTDTGNSVRLIRQGNGKLRFVHAWGKWLHYADGKWVVDYKEVLVTELAKSVAEELLAHCVTRDQFDWGMHSENRSAIRSMLDLARGVDGVLIEHEVLDADPFLLNVANGTVDLSTGELRPHDPADLLTLQSSVAFDPDAEAPLWEECLRTWQPDQDVRRYLQIRAGACATGQPTETLDIDYAGGANGKSKFHATIQFVLGPYAVVPHKSLLVAEKHEQHATVFASLFRCRMAVTSETKSADAIDEEKVKSLTGGDRIGACRMREDEWWFDPTHTLIIHTNYKPRIRGTDEAIWRRVRLVPWLVTIPEEDRDPNLQTKLRAEAPGILRWIVEGARIFLADGWDVPLSVSVATSEYHSGEDVVGRFIHDTLIVGEGAGALFFDEIQLLADAWRQREGLDYNFRPRSLAEALQRTGAENLGRVTMQGVKRTKWGRIGKMRADGE